MRFGASTCNEYVPGLGGLRLRLKRPSASDKAPARTMLGCVDQNDGRTGNGASASLFNELSPNGLGLSRKRHTPLKIMSPALQALQRTSSFAMVPDVRSRTETAKDREDG